jgi:hypothetical protein
LVATLTPAIDTRSTSETITRTGTMIDSRMPASVPDKIPERYPKRSMAITMIKETSSVIRVRNRWRRLRCRSLGQNEPQLSSLENSLSSWTRDMTVKAAIPPDRRN